MNNQNNESPKDYAASNYQRYNVNWRNFNSNYRPKVEYYNMNKDMKTNQGSVLKINNILRNNDTINFQYRIYYNLAIMDDNEEYDNEEDQDQNEEATESPGSTLKDKRNI